jgi:hypothetical protein
MIAALPPVTDGITPDAVILRRALFARRRTPILLGAITVYDRNLHGSPVPLLAECTKSLPLSAVEGPGSHNIGCTSEIKSFSKFGSVWRPSLPYTKIWEALGVA